jgi:hypothetical protein
LKYGELFLKSQKSLCWIHQPFFFLSPSDENLPQKITMFVTNALQFQLYHYQLYIHQHATKVVATIKTYQ